MTPMLATDLCHARTTCRLCASADWEPVLSLAPTPSASHFIRDGLITDQPVFPLDVMRCARCHLVQLRHTVDAEYLYTHSWERTSRDSPGMKEHFFRAVHHLRNRGFVRDGAFAVEIGSNDGQLLWVLQTEGCRVLGIDPGLDAASESNEGGISTWPVPFGAEVARRIVDTHGRADLILANNVLANVDDLADVAEGVQALLAPFGVVVFETGYLGDLVGSLVFDNIYHEHLSYFSVRPLVKLFADHGLELFDVEHVPTKGGSLRGFVQHRHGPHTHTDAAIRLMAQEDAQRLDQPATYHAMASHLERLKIELAELLQQHAGARIVGYGASLSVITLLAEFDLARHLKYLVDDNPVKHGWLTPGSHLPVYAPERLIDDNVEIAVILPWRFAGMIMEKNAQFRYRGGRFLIPVPRAWLV